MDTRPEPQDFARYPREADSSYGSVERLEALGAGYFGLNTGFMWMILTAVALIAVAVYVPAVGFVPFLLIYPVATIVATLPYNKKIAAGKGWPGWVGLVASVLVGLTTFVCGGISGCIVMQQVSVAEMRKYGVKVGFSLSKQQFRYYVDLRRELDTRPPPPIDLSYRSRRVFKKSKFPLYKWMIDRIIIRD